MTVEEYTKITQALIKLQKDLVQIIDDRNAELLQELRKEVEEQD